MRRKHRTGRIAGSALAAICLSQALTGMSINAAELNTQAAKAGSLAGYLTEDSQKKPGLSDLKEKAEETASSISGLLNEGADLISGLGELVPESLEDVDLDSIKEFAENLDVDTIKELAENLDVDSIKELAENLDVDSIKDWTDNLNIGSFGEVLNNLSGEAFLDLAENLGEDAVDAIADHFEGTPVTDLIEALPSNDTLDLLALLGRNSKEELLTDLQGIFVPEALREYVLGDHAEHYDPEDSEKLKSALVGLIESALELQEETPDR